MRTKLTWCLVSDESDTYLEQTLLSVCSARIHNPEAVTVLVVDTLTEETLKGTRAGILPYISELISAPCPEGYTKVQRSRFLKTSLRQIVRGDFLYIDNDTIICSPLDELDGINWDLAAVREMNMFSSFTKKEAYMFRKASAVGLEKELDGAPFFNGGLMYAKDNDTARSWYARWHECWLDHKSKGLNYDQIALCWANKLEGCPIHHIGDEWNCQICLDGIHKASDAKIIHYYNDSGEGRFLFSKRSIHESLKQSGEVPEVLKMMMQRPQDAFMVDAQTASFLVDERRVHWLSTKSKALYSALKLCQRPVLVLSKIMKKMGLLGE